MNETTCGCKESYWASGLWFCWKRTIVLGGKGGYCPSCGDRLKVVNGTPHVERMVARSVAEKLANLSIIRGCPWGRGLPNINKCMDPSVQGEIPVGCTPEKVAECNLAWAEAQAAKREVPE